MINKIRLLIVDDHKSFLQAFVQMVNTMCNDIRVIDTAEDGISAMDLLNQQSDKYDVVVVDMQMRRDTEAGINLIKNITSLNHPPKVLAISGYLDRPEFILRAKRSGADGYALKESDFEEIFQAIRMVYRGKDTYPSEKVSEIISHLNSASNVDRLTESEERILSLIAKGYRNKQIAEKLGYSVNTIKQKISIIYQKIHVHSRIEATKYWLERQSGLSRSIIRE